MKILGALAYIGAVLLVVAAVIWVLPPWLSLLLVGLGYHTLPCVRWDVVKGWMP